MASSTQSSNTTELKKPINIFWIETLRLEIPYDLVRSDISVAFQSDIYYLPLQREDLFCFHVVKIATNDIRVQCMRGPAYYPDRGSDTGYILRFYISMIGIDEPAKHADMRADQLDTTVILKTEYFTKKLLEENWGSYVWQLRVVVRMLEYDNLPDDHAWKAKYDEVFDSFKNEQVKTEEKKSDMIFLLRRTTLDDVFSGRQSEFFVMIKLTYITRAFRYSREIVEYFKMKQEMIMTGKRPQAPCDLNLPVVLNFICTGEEDCTPITNEDLLGLFLRAYRLGLNFLKVICTFYMVENLINSEFVIDALKTADMVDDPILLDKAMDVFIPNLNELFRSPKWIEFNNESNTAARSVLHALTYRAKYQELRVPARILDYMEESKA